MSTVSPDSVAQDQIRSFVERIMRLREEVKAINGDIREVYAEAKGNGFDKTVLGKVVNYIEKRATSAGELAEGEALFDLYLAAFDGATRVGTPVATHTHEAVGYDRLTGEVRDDIAGNGASGAEVLAQVATVRASSSANSSTAALKASAPLPIIAETAGASGEIDGAAQMPSEPAGTQAPPVETIPAYAELLASQSNIEPDIAAVVYANRSELYSEPAEGNTPTSAGHGDRGAVVPSAAPVVAEPNDYTKPNPWCLDQEECGLSSWDHFCLRCQRVKAERQAVEAVQ